MYGNKNVITLLPTLVPSHRDNKKSRDNISLLDNNIGIEFEIV